VVGGYAAATCSFDQHFEPERLDRTLDVLAAAQRAPSREDLVQAEVRRQVTEADRKLARHRAALEAGADPAIVAGWIREVQAAKAEAEAQLRRLSRPAARTLDRDELAEMTRALGDMVRVLADADPARKAKIYAGLGLRLTYHPDKRSPGGTGVHPGYRRMVRVRGGT